MTLRGVNLGGWLVAERWITPSLFAGTDATDEYTLSAAGATDRIAEHHRRFITKPDFAWLAKHGIQAVRIPVGYWIFGDEPPYAGAIEQLDFAMRTAAAHDIKVVIDLHAVPGSQNGWDHSGRSGGIGWHKNKQNITRTLEVLEKLAERYGDALNLYGIEVINEPHWSIPKRVLKKYYESAYAAVRKHCSARVAVIISDSFRPYEWADVLPAPAYENVMLDRHFYQCFSEEDKKLGMPEHIAKAKNDWSAEIAQIQKSHPLIAGEWSFALDGLNGQPRDNYAKTQTAVFKKTAAWFFWTYKTEDSQEWDLRRCTPTLGLDGEH